MKLYNPTSSGIRFKIGKNTIKSLYKIPNSLKTNYRYQQGKGSQGTITVRHKGGGHKQLYKYIDFWFFNYGKDTTITLLIDIHYDANRNTYIGLVLCLNLYLQGFKRYILIPTNIKIGDYIYSNHIPSLGSYKPLNEVRIGEKIYNIESFPHSGGKISRSSGTFAIKLNHFNKYSLLQLPSGDKRLFKNTCFVALGQVYNTESNKQWLSKAGISRYFNKRPKVRGTAQNAVDHKHGGGKGKSPIGHKNNFSFNQKYSKGIKTSNKYLKYSSHLFKFL